MKLALDMSETKRLGWCISMFLVLRSRIMYLSGWDSMWCVPSIPLTELVRMQITNDEFSILRISKLFRKNVKR